MWERVDAHRSRTRAHAGLGNGRTPPRVLVFQRLLIALVLLPVGAEAQDPAPLAAQDLRSDGRRGSLVQDARQASGSRLTGIGVRLYGGWRRLWGGDANEAAATLTQAWASFGRPELVPLRDGDALAMRRGLEYGAGLTVAFTRNFGLVGGVGWLESYGGGRVIETPASSASYATRTTGSLELRAIPVWVGGQYTYPWTRRLSLLVDGGAGLYFTRLRWLQRLEVADPTQTTDARLWDVRGYDLGVHGGVSVEVSLSKRVGVIVGVQGVHANIDRLAGSLEGTYSRVVDGAPVTRSTKGEGTFGVFRLDDGRIVTSLVGEYGDAVSRAGPLADLRAARVGLSGLRYTGGLQVAVRSHREAAGHEGSGGADQTSWIDARVYGGWRRLWGGMSTMRWRTPRESRSVACMNSRKLYRWRTVTRRPRASGASTGRT